MPLCVRALHSAHRADELGQARSAASLSALLSYQRTQSIGDAQYRHVALQPLHESLHSEGPQSAGPTSGETDDNWPLELLAQHRPDRVLSALGLSGYAIVCVCVFTFGTLHIEAQFWQARKY